MIYGSQKQGLKPIETHLTALIQLKQVLANLDPIKTALEKFQSPLILAIYKVIIESKKKSNNLNTSFRSLQIPSIRI